MSGYRTTRVRVRRAGLCGLVCVLCALVLAVVAGAKSTWPRPPSWWLHGSFASCVRQRESGNGTTTPNIYGMLDGWAAAGGQGWAGDASRAEQDYRAWILYNKYGVSPWRPYDGC